jgi:hypothetical protein
MVLVLDIDVLFEDVPVLFTQPLSNNTLFKKLTHKIISIGPLLQCKINVWSVSDVNSILGLEFHSKEAITIKQVHLDMPDSILHLETELPLSISASEVCSVLYSCRLLYCSELDRRKGVSFSVTFDGPERQEMNTHFCARLPTKDGTLISKQQAANHGRLFESATKEEPKRFSGLEVSLSVLPPVILHTVFSVKMLLSNTGSKVRNLKIDIPSTKKEYKGQFRKDIPDMAMTPIGIYM